MDNRTKTIGAILLILVLAVAAVGYAINYYAEHKGGEVDPDYLVITDLKTDGLEYDTHKNEIGHEYGQPILTTRVIDGSELVYVVDDSKVSGNYYLTLVDYVLYLDDGTVIYGTVDSTGNHTEIDRSQSTVVTSSTLKLYLDVLKPNADKEISFTVAGVMVSDSALPVASGTNAPAAAQGIAKIDVKLGVTLYNTDPVITLDLLPALDGRVVIGEGEREHVDYALMLDGVRQYGYALNWSSSAPLIATVSDTGVITGVNASDTPAVITAYFPTAGAKTVDAYVNSVEVDGSSIIDGDMLRVVIGGTSAELTPSFQGHQTATVSWVSDNGYFTIDNGTTPGTSVIKVDANARDGTSAIITAIYTTPGEANKYYFNLYVVAYDGTIDIDEDAFIVAKDGTYTFTLNKQLAGEKITYSSKIKDGSGDDDAVGIVYFLDPETGIFEPSISTDASQITVMGYNAEVEHAADSYAYVEATYTNQPMGQVYRDIVKFTVTDPGFEIKDSANQQIAGTSGAEKKLALYGSDKLQANAKDSQGAIVHWYTSNPYVLKVADDGTVTGVAEGTATVTAWMTVDGHVYSQKTKTITVTSPTLEFNLPNYTEYKGITVDKDGSTPIITLTLGNNTGYLGITTDVEIDDIYVESTNPDQVVLKSCTAETSSTTVADLVLYMKDSTGSSPVEVKAFYAFNDAPVSDSLYVTVLTPSVFIAESDISFDLGHADYELHTQTTPATGGTLTFETVSGGTTVIEVDTDGKITFNGIGTDTVKATFAYGETDDDTPADIEYYAYCKVTVNFNVNEKTIITTHDVADVYVTANADMASASVNFEPAATIVVDSTNKTKALITVGNVAGSYTITAVADAGATYTDTCGLIIPIAFGSYASVDDLAVGKTTYRPAFIISDATAVQWTSNHPEVASVDYFSGLVTGVDDGTATITATTYYKGLPYTASYEVTVGSAATTHSVTFEQDAGIGTIQYKINDGTLTTYKTSFDVDDGDKLYVIATVRSTPVGFTFYQWMDGTSVYTEEQEFTIDAVDADVELAAVTKVSVELGSGVNGVTAAGITDATYNATNSQWEKSGAQVTSIDVQTGEEMTVSTAAGIYSAFSGSYYVFNSDNNAQIEFDAAGTLNIAELIFGADNASGTAESVSIQFSYMSDTAAKNVSSVTIAFVAETGTDVLNGLTGTYGTDNKLTYTGAAAGTGTYKITEINGVDVSAGNVTFTVTIGS